jgi:hypothetical protein
MTAVETAAMFAHSRDMLMHCRRGSAQGAALQRQRIEIGRRR